MKAALIALTTCLANGAWAGCAWNDDAAIANALSGSRWEITTLSGMEVVEPPSKNKLQISLVPEPLVLDLTIGPLLRGNTMGERTVSLTFAAPVTAEGATLTAGRSTFNIPYPILTDSPCATEDLSVIVLAADRRRHLDTWAMLSVHSENRLVGLLKVAGPYATNGVGAAIYSIEAKPKP